MTFFPSCMQASRRVVLLLKWLWCFKAREEDLLMSVDHGLALLSFETPLPPRGFLLLRCGSFVWWEGGHSINTAFHDGSLNAHSLDVCFLFSLSLLLLVFWRLTSFILGCIRTIADFIHGVKLIGWCLTA